MTINFKHGLLWQDYQHEQLLSCIAELNKKRETPLEADELEKTIAFLEFYTRAHFDLEMHYMQKLRYPNIKEHSRAHEEFTHMVTTFKRKSRSVKDSSELLTELCSWLKDHIFNTDKELATFIKVRTDP